MTDIELCDRLHCTGCGVCSYVCQLNAIEMLPDEEGFLIPVINKSHCVGCGLCRKKCPVINYPSQEEHQVCVYAAYAKNSSYQKNSSSGGIFPVFAELFYNNSGSVVAAAFDQKLNLRHVISHCKGDLIKFQGSKYVQSKVHEVYQGVINLLEGGKSVFFIGTPCQVAGLRSIVGDKYENLFTIDLVCHGVPSQSLFHSWLAKVGEDISADYVDFWFRSKNKSAYFIHSLKTEKGKLKKIPVDEHSFICAYLKGWIHRESCYHCPFATLPRQGDCSISDFWSILNGKVSFGKDNNEGISMIMINTSKGEKYFDIVKSNLYYEKKTLEEAVMDNHNIHMPDIRPDIRDNVYGEMERLTPKEFMRTYSLELSQPLTIIERIINKIINLLHLKG